MKMLTSLFAILFFTICISPSVLIAATGATSTTLESIPAPPAATPVVEVKDPAAPNFLDKLLEAIKNSGGIVAGALVVVEIFLKLFPSKKPLSILVPVKYCVDSLITILSWLSNAVLIPVINLANKSEEKLKPESKA